MRTLPGLAVGLGGVPTLPEGKCKGCRRALRKVCCLQKGTPKVDLKIFLPSPPPGGSLPGSPRVG